MKPTITPQRTTKASKQMGKKRGSALLRFCMIGLTMILALGEQKVTAQTITTFAGTHLTEGDSGDGGPATSAVFGFVSGVAADHLGNIYVADYSNNVIRKIDTSGIITVFAGTDGMYGSSGDGGGATSAFLEAPFNVTVDASNNLYIVDQGNSTVRMVSAATGIISTFAGSGSYGYSPDGTLATAASFSQIGCVGIDDSGYVYITDLYDGIVRKVVGGLLTTVAGNYLLGLGFSGDGGPATSAQLMYPESVDFDSSNNMYIADAGSNRVRKVSAGTGIITTIAGNGTASNTGDGGIDSNATVNDAEGVAVNKLTNVLYVQEYNGASVRKIDLTSNIITTYAGTGVSGYSGDGGPANVAQISASDNIAVSPLTGNLFIADDQNWVVREVLASPTTFYFLNNSPQSLSVCENATGKDIDSLLTIVDSTAGETDMWTVFTNPSNGTAVATYSATSTGGALIPSGLTYTPNSGYSGADSFVIVAFNNTDTVYTKLHVTVNPLPVIASITGASSVCVGGTTMLSDVTSSGIWSAGNANASIAADGTLTGIVAGTDTIFYSATNSCGTDSVHTVITVNPLPVAGVVSGAENLCVGANTTLTTTGTGGSWSSSTPAFATVGSTSGIVHGVAAGNDTISYIVTSASCGADTASYQVLVAPAPNAGTISPAIASVCVGAETTLTTTGSGGSWSSSAGTGNASVTPLGVVTGISSGVDTIKYTVTTTCSTAVARRRVTVNPVADPGTIAGPTSVCVGTPITLTDTATGGTWSSNATAIATISAGGVVTGITGGADTIFYSKTNVCGTVSALYAITVNNATDAGVITGSSAVCVGANISLADAATGGAWSATNTNASVASDGTVTGATTGADTIIYTQTGICGTATALKAITVNDVPVVAAITGTAPVCPGANIALGDATSGGAWTSSNTAAATVSVAGSVHGVAEGNTLITYAVTNSCGTTTVTTTVTVSPSPSAGIISGADSICMNTTTTLTDTTSGGTWTSGNTAIATVDAGTGVVGGLSEGTAIISYTTTNSCGTANALFAIFVKPLPTAGTITGADNVCAGSAITLADAAAGGTWISSDNTIASFTTGGTLAGISAGTVTVSYAVTNSCSTATTTYSVTVNALPDAGTITNAGSVCLGSSITLADANSGGVWSSANPAVATVDAALGTIQGLSLGNATISYTLTSGTCTSSTTATVTVGGSPVVAPISGPSSVCLGSSISLSDSLAGGTWSSSNVSIATVDPATGVVAGLNAGSATITYVAVNACGNGNNTKTITVNNVSAVSAISGATNLCNGDVTVLSDAVSGGVWTSTNTALATIDATTGQITTLTAGIDSVIYSVTNASGCVTHATTAVTINAVPVVGAIGGTNSVCAGATTALTDTTTGGTWTSSNSGIANVSSAGVVTGVTAGTATISYAMAGSGGCISAATLLVTVHPKPAITPISGASNLCAGNNTLLTDATTGGTWSTTDNTVASITTSGSLTGIMAGTVTVSYVTTNTFGCINKVNKSFTVNALPVGGSITGPSEVCMGTTITLTDAAGGGVWIGNNAAAATVDPATGVVTPVAPGSVLITYSVTNTCGSASASTTITVSPQPVAGVISGGNIVCPTGYLQLIDTVSGGTWTSSDNSVAGVNPFSGLVMGVGTGTTTITYAVTTSCGTATATDSIAGNPMPEAITGITTVCAGLTTTLSDATPGGNWISADPLTANVNTTTGVVGGINVGSTTISYSAGAGCTNYATVPVTVNALPSVNTITGPASLCAGTNIALGETTADGVWSSSDVTIATVDAAGNVTGINAGTTEVAYTVTNLSGCSNAANKIVTVNAITALSPIAGVANLCQDNVYTFTDTTSGGTWSSSDYSVADVDEFTGDVIAIAPGSATITYTAENASGCVTEVDTTVTVNAVPDLSATTGTDSVCAGATSLLSNATPGGVWSSADTTIATVDATGLVTGIAGGTVTISYQVTNPGGCSNAAYVAFTVAPLPVSGTISGAGNVCQGSVITLLDSATGGNWSSSDTTVATIDAAGNVTGVMAGTATISYTSINGCATASSSFPVTVNSLPVVSAISGANNICVVAKTVLTDSAIGGVWTVGNSNASIDSTGTLIGNTAGIDTITYTVTNAAGCMTAVSFIDTINALPVVPAISGPSAVCVAANITLTSGTIGAWSASNGNASVVAGVVTGNLAGTDTITYTEINAAGCSMSVDTVITINALPAVAPITDSATVCSGSTITFTNDTLGGTWTASNDNATIDSTGLVTGIMGGVDTITYSLTNVCGTATATDIVTINQLPVLDTISGITSVCVGSAITLTDDSTGGVWTISNGNATVDASGMVIGVNAGTDTVTYTSGGVGCATSVSAMITINAVPAVGAITDSSTVCSGATLTFTNDTLGGVWNVSNGNATIDSTGLLTGVMGGVDTITYTLSNVCGTAAVAGIVTVNQLPVLDAIAGGNSLCIGSTIGLTDDSTGGTWSVSNGTATIDATGLVTGITTGMDTVTYTSGGVGCSATVTEVITINALPATVGAISGANNICDGVIVTLTDTTLGGIWSSSDTSIVTVDSLGNVTGVGSGIAVITYGIANGCGTSAANFVINASPIPTVDSIMGATTSTCSGLSFVLSDATPGGVWGTSDFTIAGVNALGVVTGVSAGNVVITYMVTNSGGCSATATYSVTIGAPFPVTTILPSGSVTLCGGSPVNLVLTPASATGITYQWEINGDAIAGATNSSYMTDTAGLFTVTLSNSTCSGSIGPVNVVAPPHPVVAYNSVSNALFTGSFASYQWYYNGNVIPGATTSILSEPTPGAYTVVVEDGNGCTVTSAPYVVTSSATGVGNVANIDVKVYPNPATSILQISAAVKVNVIIMSLDGKIVIDQKDATSIDINGLSNGMYIIKVYDEQNTLLKTDKFAKVQ